MLQINPFLYHVAVIGGTTQGRLSDPIAIAALFAATTVGVGSKKRSYPALLTVVLAVITIAVSEYNLREFGMAPSSNYMLIVLFVSSAIIVWVGWLLGRTYRYFRP